MAQKLEFNKIKSFFEKHNCKLLEKKYVNSATLMNYICCCGEKAMISFNKFQAGRRCQKCGIKRRVKSQRLSQPDVEKIFIDGGCQLVDTYVNSKIPVTYICECGQKKKIALSNFQNGKRCKDCAGNSSPSLEKIKKLLADKDCKLISKNYVNRNTPLKFQCSCGKIALSTYRTLQKSLGKCKECVKISISASQRSSEEEVHRKFSEKELTWIGGKYENFNSKLRFQCNRCRFEGVTNLNSLNNSTFGCSICGRKKRDNDHRLSLDIVKERFKQNGLILLSDEFTNSHTHIWYMCSVCKDIDKTTLISINQGCGCRKCSIESTKLPIEEVAARFHVQGLELLPGQKYTGISQSLFYRCQTCDYEGSTAVHHVSGCYRCSRKNGRDFQKKWNDYDFTNDDVHHLLNQIKKRIS